MMKRPYILLILTLFIGSCQVDDATDEDKPLISKEYYQRQPYVPPSNSEGSSGGGSSEVTYEGEGTLEKPYTVADAIKYAKSFGQAESDKQVYIKGYITNITEEYSTNYGNATFDISDSKDGGNKFTIYRGLYLGNKKFTSGNTQIKKGDEVIIYGKVVNYRGNNPETVQNAAYLYSLNGVTAGGGADTPTAEAKGTGTLEDPFTVAGAIAYAMQVGSGESDKEVYIKGKVSKIIANYVADNYGNATFNISEDGTSTDEFYCYHTLYLDNQKYTNGKLLELNDNVIICGKPQFRNLTNSLRALRSKPPRMRFLLFKLAFCHVLTDMIV